MEDFGSIIKLYADKIELLHSQIDSLEADSTTLELLVNAIKSAIKKSDYSSGYDLDSKFVLDAFKVLLPVGTVVTSDVAIDPAALYGGTWEQIPESEGVIVWRRTA